MRRFARDHRVIAVGDDQPGRAWKEARTLANRRQRGGHRPIKAVAIIEIVQPRAVADQIGLGDFDLNNGEAALWIDRHHVGAATIWQRHLADCEQVLPAEQAGHSASDFGRDRGSVSETERIGLAGHGQSLEQCKNGANPRLAGNTRVPKKTGELSLARYPPAFRCLNQR